MSIADFVTLLDGEASRRNRRVAMSRWWLPLTVLVVDTAVILMASAGALLARSALPVFERANDVDHNVATASGFIVAGWLAMIFLGGAYRQAVFGAGTEEYGRVLNASLATAALLGVGAYLLGFPLSRGFFVMLFVIGIPLLLLARFLIRRFVQQMRRGGLLGRRVLLVGTPGHVAEIGAVLRRESWLGYRVVGCLVPDKFDHVMETATGIPVLGSVREVTRHVLAEKADVVLFSGGAYETAADLRRAAWDLEDHAPVQIVVTPNVTDVSHERISVRPVAGLPLVHLERPRSRQGSIWAKRVFDVAAAALLILASAPLMAAVALWIRLTDGGPVFFQQDRVGRDGETFPCFKLRSMVVDAEKLKASMPTRDDHNLFKLKHDPRITRPGRFIRRFSIDELPQLWSVVRGDMSLIGPRPPLPDEVSRYEKDVLRRLKVRPGLTGLWQVSGRSDLSWEDTVRLDLYYVDNWSLVQDLVILLRTVSAVLKGRGAY